MGVPCFRKKHMTEFLGGRGSKGSFALLVEGVRRVGKTTLVAKQVMVGRFWPVCQGVGLAAKGFVGECKKIGA